MGIRIEDDYLITETGAERITSVPREIDDVEALREGATREQGFPSLDDVAVAAADETVAACHFLRIVRIRTGWTSC